MAKEAKYITIQEAARLLGLSTRTIREWVEDGLVRSIKGAGNRRLILRSSLAALSARAKRQTGKGLCVNDRFVHGFKVPDGFDLITTYEELHEYSVAFANGDLKFLLLVGSPGSGKSKQLKANLAEHKHKWIDNHASLLGLYCSVYEAGNSPIVMDDINHFFRNTSACSLMKALTQTDQIRSVSWESTATALDRRKVPRQFRTSSSICLIANRWHRDDPDMAAIQDRSVPVAFFPSAETIHERVCELGWCDDAVWRFIGDNLSRIPQPSMREYFNAMSYKNAGMKWRDKMLKIWGE
jgi:excisionase family DNA binding protein